jgi:DnaK suppressor protein
MTKAQLDELKNILLKMKSDILNGGYLSKRDDLHVSQEDLPDEADLASSIVNQQVTFNMRERELAKLRSIDMALQSMEDGLYGYCEECDEPIAYKRLKTQPFATLCITHAEERERQHRFQKIG